MIDPIFNYLSERTKFEEFMCNADVPEKFKTGNKSNIELLYGWMSEEIAKFRRENPAKYRQMMNLVEKTNGAIGQVKGTMKNGN